MFLKCNSFQAISNIKAKQTTIKLWMVTLEVFCGLVQLHRDID